MGRIGVVIDAAVVVVFVAIGRSVHSHGLSALGMADTAWPFLAGLGLGWVVSSRWRGTARIATLGSGLVTVASTVVVGMVLRVVSGQGTAVAFVGVAFAFLGAGMLTWRAIERLTTRAGRVAVPGRESAPDA